VAKTNLAKRAPKTTQRGVPAPQVEADWSRGMIRDAPRTALPVSSVYDAADYILALPGLAYKRGGSAFAGPALTGATYAAGVAFAEFPAGNQIIGLGSNANLYTITAGSAIDRGALGTGHPTRDTPKLAIDKLILTASNGTTSPRKFDGTTIAALGGTPPAGKYAALYKSRLALANSTANPNRIWFSPVPNIESTWDTALSFIDADYPIIGMAPLQNALLCFSQGHTERIIGDTPPPGSNMDRAPIGAIGCTDARSIVVHADNAIFANPRGVFMSNGAGFASLTQDGLIETYWQSLFTGYDPATWVISGGSFRDYYVVTILNASGTIISCLMCNVARRAWWRLTNVDAMMFASAAGVQEELYYADRSTNRIVALSGFFSPTATNKNDADGTAVAPLIEMRLIGLGVGIKTFGHARLTYDMRDAATDNPALAITVAEGVEADTFAAVVESPFLETTVATRKRFKINKRSQGVTVRLAQTGPSSQTELYALEVEQLALPLQYGGQ
jgi:hypothetical protein